MVSCQHPDYIYLSRVRAGCEAAGPETLFNGKTIIITGSTSGIGRACAQAFAASGGTVVVCGRDEGRVDETVRALTASGGRALGVRCDVSVEPDCRALVEKALEATGRVDVLVNNAGMAMRALFGDTGIEVLKKLMDVNFWGAVYCTKHALPALLESRGSVVGISSVAGKKGLPGRTGYSASKFALEGFLQTLRIEYMNRGLHVLVACPGFTTSNIRKRALKGDGSVQEETPRDEGKMMPAETVARHIVEAVRRRRRDLVLTTEGRAVIFLDKWFPGWSDRMLYRHMAAEPGAPIPQK